MKFERKIRVLLIGLVSPYLCAVLALVYYMQGHPGPLPHWIYTSMALFFLFILVVGSVIVTRVVSLRAAVETPEEGKQRRARTSKRLKAGLVLYVLILLNGIRLVAQNSLPWSYAIPGLAIDLFLIAIFWFSLRRLKRTEIPAAESGQNPIPSK